MVGAQSRESMRKERSVGKSSAYLMAPHSQIDLRGVISKSISHVHDMRHYLIKKQHSSSGSSQCSHCQVEVLKQLVKIQHKSHKQQRESDRVFDLELNEHSHRHHAAVKQANEES